MLLARHDYSARIRQGLLQHGADPASQGRTVAPEEKQTQGSAAYRLGQQVGVSFPSREPRAGLCVLRRKIIDSDVNWETIELSTQHLSNSAA